MSIYVNGALQAQANLANTPLSGTSVPLSIGRYSKISLFGYLDSLRITKGVARYTANFSVPTEANPTLIVSF